VAQKTGTIFVRFNFIRLTSSNT